MAISVVGTQVSVCFKLFGIDVMMPFTSEYEAKNFIWKMKKTR